MGTFSIWHWLIVLLVVVLVFGSKKLVDIGPNVGKAWRGFQDSMSESPKTKGAAPANSAALESREASGEAASAAASAQNAAEKTASS